MDIWMQIMSFLCRFIIITWLQAVICYFEKRVLIEILQVLLRGNDIEKVKNHWNSGSV